MYLPIPVITYLPVFTRFYQKWDCHTIMHKEQYLTHDSYTTNVNDMTIILQTNNNLQFGNDKKVVIFGTPKSETVPLFKSILII